MGGEQRHRGRAFKQVLAEKDATPGPGAYDPVRLHEKRTKAGYMAKAQRSIMGDVSWSPKPKDKGTCAHLPMYGSHFGGLGGRLAGLAPATPGPGHYSTYS